MGPPKGLDTDWCRCIAGEWRGSGEGVVGKGDHWMKVELALDNQFMLTEYRSTIVEMTNQHVKYMKDKMNMSEEDIERVRRSTFHELGIQTIDPATGEIVTYVFDSWRTILKGTGKQEGNKEIIRFSNRNISSIRVMEKVSHNKLMITQKWDMPDGSVMTETGEMTRINSAAES